MLGSEFVAAFRKTGLPSWEAAAVELAREGLLLDHPFVDLRLSDPTVGEAVVRVRSDVLAVGSEEDHLRLPLTPSRAQDALNFTGELLPTPLLVWRIWEQASLELEPKAMVPNKGADLDQYLAHSKIIDAQVTSSGVPKVAGAFSIAGIKKSIVVSNILVPGTVVIFGWYRPSPPAADVFDDRTNESNPKRQPIQPLSNVHGSFYVDYSHGIRGVHPECLVNGQTMETEALYRDLKLSKLVSNEGPIRTPRYPSKIAVAVNRPIDVIENPAAIDVVPVLPTVTEAGFAMLTKK